MDKDWDFKMLLRNTEYRPILDEDFDDYGDEDEDEEEEDEDFSDDFGLDDDEEDPITKDTFDFNEEEILKELERDEL